MEKNTTPEDILRRLYLRAESIAKAKEKNESLLRFWKLAQIFFTSHYVNRAMEEKGETDVQHFIQTHNFFGIPTASAAERKSLLNRICADVKHGRKVSFNAFIIQRRSNANGVHLLTAFMLASSAVSSTSRRLSSPLSRLPTSATSRTVTSKPLNASSK
jgi:hypothetical protein